MTIRKAQLAKCSPDKALLDINELLERSVFVKNEGGDRSTRCRLADPDSDSEASVGGTRERLEGRQKDQL